MAMGAPPLLLDDELYRRPTKERTGPEEARREKQRRAEARCNTTGHDARESEARYCLTSERAVWKRDEATDQREEDAAAQLSAARQEGDAAAVLQLYGEREAGRNRGKRREDLRMVPSIG
jgi:hypothetical protein